MTTTTFNITRRGSKWFVQANQEVHGPYLSQYAATEDAIDAAEQMATEKSPITIVVSIPRKEEEVIWHSSSWIQ